MSHNPHSLLKLPTLDHALLAPCFFDDRLLKPLKTSHQPGLWECSGLPQGGGEALALVDLCRYKGKEGVLHIAESEGAARNLQEAFSFFAPEIPVLYFPPWDCLPYDRASPAEHVVAQRLHTLCTLMEETPLPYRLILTTAQAVGQRLPPKAPLRECLLCLKPGHTINRDALISLLLKSGYRSTPTVLECGDYAVRGSLIDLFPPGTSHPFRLDFFGETLDSLRLFDPKTQRSTEQRHEVTLKPASEVMLTPETIAYFRQGYQKICPTALLAQDPLYHAISAGHRAPGMEHWLPLFYTETASLFSYLPPNILITQDQHTQDAMTARCEEIADYYNARLAALDKKTFGSPPYSPLPKEALYLSPEEWKTEQSQKQCMILRAFETPFTFAHLGGTLGKKFTVERQHAQHAPHAPHSPSSDSGSLPNKKSQNRPYQGLYPALSEWITILQNRGKRVGIAASSDGARDRLEELLRDMGLFLAKSVASWQDFLSHPPSCVGIVTLPLESGFEIDGLAFLSEQDIFGERLVRRRKKTSRKALDVLSEMTNLSAGDVVVHIDHGIARFQGLKTLTVGGTQHDCLHLEYAGGDRLFVPVENSDRLTRFGGEDSSATLDKLGGSAWSLRKAKLKKDLLSMAGQLMHTAASRVVETADPIASNNTDYDAFCARFPYAETEDQQTAIDDVLSDLNSGHPMDRLVCGDVGFGKTEVALRAACAVALSGKQVALVAPTTLLARQHYAQFLQRFEGFPIRIAPFSRLVSAQDAKRNREELATGRMDIAIGTHALLASKIHFSDLGLLIIDEEQHFGVKHKERLKELKKNVHVLTLTATPIPRTLQLALSGVRELSLITTPPVDRLAVRTVVSPFDPVVIREYLLRELYRGGQSFFVVPRISDIEEMATFLSEYVPEVTVAKAHGRLSPSAVEEIMTGFYERSYDVLLATTIIESGLDVSTANTLIVYRADRFGLAQLYQIRGRVGRSTRRAYALLTTPSDYILSPSAQKRLDVLQSLDTLGAGFTLASHDLDLRGAGNLLGDVQSGHVKEVGFELYQTMLEEAIAELKAQEKGAEKPLETHWPVQMNLGLSVLIPESYITESDLRLALYRRLAEITQEEELDGFAIEMRDRFGPFPQDVETLLAVMRLKVLCRNARIESLETGPKGLLIGFRNGQFPNPEGLVHWLQNHHSLGKIRPDMKIFLQEIWKTRAHRLLGITQVVREIASLLHAV